LGLCGEDCGVLDCIIQLIVGKSSQFDYQVVQVVGCTGLEGCRNRQPMLIGVVPSARFASRRARARAFLRVRSIRGDLRGGGHA
jgi:hypothetical protein